MVWLPKFFIYTREGIKDPQMCLNSLKWLSGLINAQEPGNQVSSDGHKYVQPHRTRRAAQRPPQHRQLHQSETKTKIIAEICIVILFKNLAEARCDDVVCLIRRPVSSQNSCHRLKSCRTSVEGKLSDVNNNVLLENQGDHLG